MGYASWKAFDTGSRALSSSGLYNHRLGCALYASQLVLNLTWMPLFFGLKKRELALADLGLLWVNILAVTAVWHRVEKTASYLMLPYLAWVTFAMTLNSSLVLRDRESKRKGKAKET